jgi:hypothetical protein
MDMEAYHIDAISIIIVPCTRQGSLVSGVPVMGLCCQNGSILTGHNPSNLTRSALTGAGNIKTGLSDWPWPEFFRAFQYGGFNLFSNGL